MIRLALTKGRIEEKALGLLEKCGYDCSELSAERRGRRLLFDIPGTASQPSLQIVLVKAADVVTYIEHGVCDAGIVGEDTIMEQATSLYELLDLGYGVCRFALAGPSRDGKGKDEFFRGYSHKIIASKYPKVAAEYFNNRGMDVEVVKIEGSVELGPLLGLADAIVDIVETGSTLKANGLEIYEDIAPVSARLAANVASVKMKKGEIDGLTSRLAEVIAGE